METVHHRADLVQSLLAGREMKRLDMRRQLWTPGVGTGDHPTPLLLYQFKVSPNSELRRRKAMPKATAGYRGDF